MKIALIGGGVSNVFAALNLNKEYNITIFEKENKILKKVLLTGNGKCNIWNAKLNKDNINLKQIYNTDNYDVLNDILKNRLDVFTYLVNDLGIFLKAKGDYFYPYSKNASSIREFLCNQLNLRENIKINLETEIISIDKQEDKFYLKDQNNNEYCFDKVIIGTALKSSNLGSDSLNKLIDKENIIKMYPALVPITLNEKFLSDWNNIRCDGCLSLKVGDEFYKEMGELQLTNYGISGIAAFNLSGKINRLLSDKKEFLLSIDFMPDYNGDELLKLFTKRNNLTIENIFETIFNYKLSFILIKESGLTKDTIWNDLTENQKNSLINLIKNFIIHPTGTLDFSRSQVTSGGVSLNCISNYELNHNLYVIGEALNVDGICGGYNLAFAIICGYNIGKML